MNNTVLQVPINKTLKDNVTKIALNMGFSSLQELTRVFLREFVKGNLSFGFIVSPTAKKLTIKK
ncbi:hypothetical protein KKC08_05375 [Patescibacteria group bacterium]|nr:hypothetical protein [Patescibacteria group bacterium]MCG2701917.1 hypothetical protein [Candidatus Parcubacteria bacterium]MBU4265188.1 hypothetical protein [Patescibacteria group bacterium]MBU4390752.1 hypothetical protein [Patescibacteria group bacterium]MBU4397569.1 hypothetical protein [Patescibacteria group bacterium]